MQLTHRIVLTGVSLGAASALATPAMADTIDLSVALPRLSVAEYHKPYVAIWLEKTGAPARTLSVWYDQGKRNNGGLKWVNDLRAWWRVAGRSMTLPADGVSGATKAPGPQRVNLPVGTLANGAYTLVIEAARENGGREVVRVPFNWSGSQASGRAAGSAELGAVSLTVRR
ncbi:DUF2271 domain-containing protein [Novosphingobium sp. JCM 18896]|uniref:DUF2271 domain-containing protein n=1 Tax=Novosphingobium sp. JCM 18896 TaxID=2989731 RepID=UPI0022225C1F|nr:DUF2271 domain-containing protein [Novosphingobium sp. JCM 18896]MCW1429890.1 DUF2271 domain-containing protein [Novosphingobium sp. JCM 18896]